MTEASKKKILIAEDDQDIRDLYVFVLTNAGYEPKAVGDGSAALAEAQKGGFDLILLDLMMPSMSGLDFLKELKKHTPQQPNGPIIVMSNLAYSEAKDEAIELGASDFLVKAELEPKQIIEKVKKMLE